MDSVSAYAIFFLLDPCFVIWVVQSRGNPLVVALNAGCSYSEAIMLFIGDHAVSYNRRFLLPRLLRPILIFDLSLRPFVCSQEQCRDIIAGTTAVGDGDEVGTGGLWRGSFEHSFAHFVVGKLVGQTV